MDEDPDFTYAMSSAQQYAWLEQEHPDLFARMLQRIKEGRFIPVGGMWVESDNMLLTGESLIRQITFGMRYFREHLGVEPKGLWLPDSFGYCGAWPQIARRAGFEWFLTQKISWNDTTKFPTILRMGLNQFHDILPGSAIAWVHRQARADYVRDIARLRDIAAEAGASIASVRDDADMRSNAAIVPYTAKNGDSWIARTAAVGTQDDDANGTDAVADESTIATTCDDGRIILDNGLLRAIIAPDGTVRSLIDLDNGHELVPDGSGIGHYELLRDEPYEWDAWDIQRDAFLSAEGIDDSHVERVTETKRGGATVHVSSTTDGVSIDACITLRAKSKSLELRTKVDWRASERFLKVDIPMLSSRPGAVRMPVRHGGTAHSEEHTFRRGEIRKLHAPVRTRRRCRLCGCGRQRQHLRFRRFADSPEHGFRAGAWHDDSTFVAVVPAIPRSEH